MLLYQGEEVVAEVVGNLISDELFVGPDPLDEDTSFDLKDGRLNFGKAFVWASDFNAAVNAGMGFRVPITAEQASAGFSKVLALGVHTSSDADDSRRLLEGLIDNHHFSPKGFALMRQGTPTNNTEEGAAGFTASDPFNVTSYFTDAGKPLFTADEDKDGRILADALGIDYAPLQFVANADATDQQEASALNTALYPATLGYYIDTMLAPVLDEHARSSLRDFFLQHVSGRGPVPAIRVGNQPYGILLTSDFSHWQWSRPELAKASGFLTTLQATLNKYHDVWLTLLPQFSQVGKQGEMRDPEAVLMDALGLQPGSVSFNQRTAYSTDYLLNRDGFQYGGQYFDDVKKNFTSKTTLLAFLQSLGYARGADGQPEVP